MTYTEVARYGASDTDVLTPEIVGDDDGEFAPFADGCPNCEAVPHESMKPCYHTDHCYACGYRPGSAVGSETVVRRAVEDASRFRSQMADLMAVMEEIKGARGMVAPSNDAEVQELKRRLEEQTSELARYKTSAGSGMNDPTKQASL